MEYIGRGGSPVSTLKDGVTRSVQTHVDHATEKGHITYEAAQKAAALRARVAHKRNSRPG